MTVLTVYNHGTGSSSTHGYDGLEIVTIFGKQHREADPGGRHLRWFVTEGVGSTHDPASSGPLTIDMKTGRLVEGEKRSSKLSVFHMATGAGVQDNVQRFMTLMTYRAMRNELPTAINMVGWSRGAVTCIRMAYELHQCTVFDGTRIPVNIFAVDPVAGGSADAEVQGSKLFPNVRNFFGILARNERRSTFAAKTWTNLVVADPAKTQVCYLNFPGVHQDVARISGEPGIVTFDLCARFLRAFGTVVPAHAGWIANDHKLLQCYFNMALGKGRIGIKVSTAKKIQEHVGWSAGNTGFGDWAMSKGSFQNRRIDTARNVSDDEVFINVHHELVFKSAYPALYKLIFNSDGLSAFQWLQAFASPAHKKDLATLDLYSKGISEILGRLGRQPQIPAEPAWERTLEMSGMLR